MTAAGVAPASFRKARRQSHLAAISRAAPGRRHGRRDGQLSSNGSPRRSSGFSSGATTIPSQPDQDQVDPKGAFVGANDGASGVALLMQLGEA